MGVQVGAVLSEAEPWPLLTWFATTYMGTTTLGYDELYKLDNSTQISATRIAMEPVEINFFIIFLQQFSTLWLLRYIYPNLHIIGTSTKAYGHLTWWTAEDPIAMRSLLSTDHIMHFQDQMNKLLPNFCISLCPYLLLTRGPVVALAFFLMSYIIRV